MTWNTDKVQLGYLPTYQRLAYKIGSAGRVCEVGVYRGGSLELWQRLFPQGLVVGVDKAASSYWPPLTVRVVADQTNPRLPHILWDHSPGGYDLIVDDASHDGEATRQTWELLWPLVRPGRWYVIEDWQVGFPSWPDMHPHYPSMLTTAQWFLGQFDHPDGDVEMASYRYGQIILEKKPHAS